MRYLLATLVCLFAVLSLVPAPADPASSGRASAIAVDLPPCATEDSDDCYWDASSRDNGLGQSFTVRNGVVRYLPY